MKNKNQKIKKVNIFTDGACKGNPGKGGWGALLIYNGVEKELSGGEMDTTNNRMELMAVIKALESLKFPCSLNITSDSTYVLKGITEWLKNWKKNNWKTAAKKEVKNADLWQRLDQLVQQHEIQWHWVKGHSGHLENERVDQLANLGIENLPIDNESL